MARTVRSTLALIFLLAGIVFLAGTEWTLGMFQQIGLGQWLRYAAGLSAICGGLLLLVKSRAVFGSAIAATMSLGALLVQVFMALGSPVLSVVIALLSGGALVQAQLDQPVATRRR